ncbi:MAG TPA: hypothetical protein VMS30_05175 [Phycisphaerales bacterium]|jgi:hypothetical protein|nr:hypothetical protein [Phycisphaerales bacterium]
MLAMFCAIAAIVAGVFGWLMMLTFCMACAPNSSPSQLHAIKMWMLAIAVAGLLTLVGGIWLTAAGRAWIGAGLGGLPAAVMFVFIVWLSFK